MQAVEALQRLINMSDELLSIHPTQRPANEDKAEGELAVAVGQAMLNTAMPVAKYRAFIEIDPDKTKAQKKAGLTVPYKEFTICSVDMDGIISGLVGLSSVELQCRVSLFEQRATGADMLLAFDGKSKTQSYRIFVGQLKSLELRTMMQ